ncbi:hypothetical protein GCM10017687_05400 [Streptomyces echinatus]|uniref:MarR family winged helix-turn-helix transcriptional regulator n=1 Tax=Streptomyces echinatus TaxID=67293 RepID=UPI0031F0CD93
MLASLQDHRSSGSQATLSGRTGIHRSDMVGVLNELAERHLVERTPDPDDQRRNIITISTGGPGPPDPPSTRSWTTSTTNCSRP